MNNTSVNTNTVKRGRGRPKKDAVANNVSTESEASTGIPGLMEPNIHDLNDELVRMDSFVYGRYYNE
jgi:hypothetical protein